MSGLCEGKGAKSHDLGGELTDIPQHDERAHFIELSLNRRAFLQKLIFAMSSIDDSC